MKFKTKKDEFGKSIAKLAGISVKHVSLPVLGCFLFETKDSKLYVRATNLNVGVEVHIKAVVEQDGIFAIEASLLNSVISSMKGDDFISCVFENNLFKITTDQNKVSLKTQSHEDFPALPYLSNPTAIINLPTREFVDCVKHVAYAASQSPMKPEIASLYLHTKEDGSLYFVSTDGYRLAEKKSDIITDPLSLLFPIKNTTEIMRVLAYCDEFITMNIYDHMVTLSDKDTYITQRVIDGVYPNYEAIIPKEWKQEITLFKKDLDEVLKINNTFSGTLLRLSIETNVEKNSLVFKSEDQERGSSYQEIECRITGEDVLKTGIVVNHRYLQEVVSNMSGDSITFLVGEKKPLIVKDTAEKDFLYLLMPMK